ncbi:MAG: hydantoinase B/oxoprolinase family protein [Saprospiraceae bacterium]
MLTFDTMVNRDNTWQIAIDTGGTFTDCLGISPEGISQRVKVLSSSTLRGVLVEKVKSHHFKFKVNWSLQKDIFQNYEIRLLNGQLKPGQLISMDFEQNILMTSEDFDCTTPQDFEITAHEEAPILAIRILTATSLSEALPPLALRLGSTKGTNALLEKKGARVAFLVTEGFKDLIRIGTQQRPHLFQLAIREPDYFYETVIEVKERMTAQGEVLISLTENEMAQILARLRKQEIEVVAIAFLHAYCNAIHETQLAAYLQKNGIRFISCSSQLSASIKILPRAQTTLVNAYLSPIIANYLSGIQTKLAAQQFKVMTSAGGLVDAQLFAPKDSLLSGPAGGLVGAAQVGKALGFSKLLSFDMGGTSTDTARYDDAFDYDHLTKVADAELLSPTLAIETVAAGGGSICYFDGYKLCVGPESAGAYPGPACYGAGGPLTISDVNLLLVKLDPSAFSIPVKVTAAEEALENLRQAIITTTNQKYTQLELLQGFERIANEKMAEAIRKISVAQGFDPEDYALVVFGGAGGLHACQLADLLAIETIILPYDGGLLSAYGISVARIERIVERQILKDWEYCQTVVASWVAELVATAVKKMQIEGFAAETVIVQNQTLFFRFEGQNSSLGIEWTQGTDCRSDFEKKYRQLFGYFPTGKTIVLERIKVLVSNRSENSSVAKEVDTTYQAAPTSYLMRNPTEPKTAVFDWESLKAGATITGPAILKNNYATSFIEVGWQLRIQADQNALLRRIEQKRANPISKTLIALELFTHRFEAIAQEMGAQLQRTAFSVNIKERLDFSCALLDANAQLLVNAPHIPVHLGSLGICARLVREKIELNPGDIVMTNHPKYGGSHLPDITLLSAVFSPEGTRIGYVVNRAHHAEIGGKRPGSMPPDATCLAEEGVVILPSYLVKKGEVQWDAVEQLFTKGKYPTRAFKENWADLNAALASLKTGEDKLRALVVTQGLERVHFYMNQLQETSFATLQKALVPYRGKTFSAKETLDDGHQICVEIIVEEEAVRFDFAGTSAVHPFNLNANLSIVYSAIIYVLRLLCAKDIPLNEGLMKNVVVNLPICFLNPDFKDEPEACPAVVGGNTECSQRLVDTLIKAFGLAACSQGTMNNFLFGNDAFGYYETIGGGCGAGPGFVGRSAVHQHMTNTRMTDPEELEFHYPVRLQACAVRAGSGGKGKWQGGDGILRRIVFLAPLEITLLGQHRLVAPYGMEGGENGACGEQYLQRKDGTLEELAGIMSKQVQRGDQIIIKTPGGGGWGKPS